MDRKEYERRRRALEELYETDLRFLRAAHESRVRSLEALWLALEGDSADAAPVAALNPAPEAVGLPAPGPVPALAPAPEAPAPRPQNPDLRLSLEAILPGLPTAFEKKDVVQALGWAPSRSSLHRVLSDMCYQGILQFEFRSGGRTPSRYRKV
jgi:hypothetical protein